MFNKKKNVIAKIHLSGIYGMMFGIDWQLRNGKFNQELFKKNLSETILPMFKKALDDLDT